MMKVAFVHFGEENIGIEYLSAVLKEKGHEVRLFFDPLLFDDIYFQAKSLAKFFSSESKILKDVKEFNPKIICFSVISDLYVRARRLAKELKKLTKAYIVFGGIHATSVPEEVIKNRFIDFVIVGEGEHALLDLVSSLEKRKNPTKIPNIWAKKGDKIFKNCVRPLSMDIDRLPFPDKKVFYDVVPHFSYVYTTITSRGCPFSCTYCNNSYMKKLYGKSPYFRRRSVDNVIKELKIAKERYRPKKVIFHDEVFTMDQNWLEEFAGKYKEEVDIPYFCWVHPATVSEKVVKLLKESGCSDVEIGFQTAWEDTRENILNRRYSNEKFENAIALLKNNNFFVSADNILGIPGQDEEEVLDLARFYSKNKVNFINVFFLRYYPKTEIVNIALSRGKISDSEVKRIYQNSDKKYFSLAGSAYSKDIEKLRALILVSGSLSHRVVNWIINKKAYRWFPTGSGSFLNPFFINLAINKIKQIASKKNNWLPTKIKIMTYLKFMKGKIFQWG